MSMRGSVLQGRPWQSRRSAPRPLLVLGCIGLLVALALQRDFGPQGFWVPWKALLLALLLLSPAFSRALFPRDQSNRPTGAVPLLALLGVIHAIYYALPVLVQDRVVGMLVEPPVAALERALDLGLLGVLGFALGQALPSLGKPAVSTGTRGLLPARRSPDVPRLKAIDQRPGTDLTSHAQPDVAPTWHAERARALMWMCLPSGVLAEFCLRSGLVPGLLIQPAKLLALLLQVGLGLAVLLWRRSELPRSTAIPLLAVGVPLFLLASLSEGAIGAAVKGGAFLLALAWATGARVPLSALLLLAAGALILRGGAMEFRSLSKQHPHLVAEGGLERAATFVRLSLQEFERDGGQRSFETILDRLSQVALLGHVVDKTPLAVPYWGGSSYVSLPQSLVPRAFWPDKPVKDLGQRFAHRYAIIDAEDRNTSINFPQLIEMYCNFGALGVFAGMAVFGLFCRILMRRLYGAGVGPVAALLGALWLGGLASVESDLSLVVGGMLQQGLVIGPLLLWIQVRKAPGLSRRLSLLRGGATA
jgi:hypothetical protein